MKFEIGDRVIAVIDECGIKDQEGIIIGVDKNDDIFDKYIGRCYTVFFPRWYEGHDGVSNYQHNIIDLGFDCRQCYFLYEDDFSLKEKRLPIQIGDYIKTKEFINSINVLDKEWLFVEEILPTLPDEKFDGNFYLKTHYNHDSLYIPLLSSAIGYIKRKNGPFSKIIRI